jgi:hypothetical protein
MTRALVGNADAHWRLGDGATAFELVEKAGRLAESLEMRPLLMRALRLEARIARHTGDRDREDAAETKCQLLERWLGQHDARGEAPSAGQGKK